MSEGSCSDYTVIIPVLNEAEALPIVLRELVESGVPRERVLIVDGYSSDGSREIAESMGFRVILQEGRGKAMAVKTGVENTGSECIVFMDGDYTYPARHIHDLLRQLENGYDLVIGSRVYLEKGSQSVLFKLGNKVLSLFFKILFGVKLSDVLSGMYSARRKLLREIGFEFTGFSVESEIIAHAASTGFRVTEVPISYRKRVGRKKLGVRHGFKIALDMVRLTWRYSPVFLIFALGALMLIPGLYLDIFVLYRWLYYGVVHHVRALAGITLSGLGVLCSLLAVLALYLKRFEIRVMKTMREIRELDENKASN
ncbi:MAG: glycosyltransferase family 2 protein [Desulfurococcaceae archaeon]